MVFSIVLQITQYEWDTETVTKDKPRMALPSEYSTGFSLNIKYVTYNMVSVNIHEGYTIGSGNY